MDALEDRKNADFYQKLRVKIKKWVESGEGKASPWAEYILFAPDLFHLLCKLVVDPDVSPKEKAKIAFAIAYFISPIDLMPEALLGPLGYADDVVLATYVLNSVIQNTPDEVIVRHWAGERDAVEVIRHILSVADEMIGSGLIRKLKEMLNKK